MSLLAGLRGLVARSQREQLAIEQREHEQTLERRARLCVRPNYRGDPDDWGFGWVE